MVVVARERYDRIAGAASVEPRDPFLDLRLMRCSYGLPDDQLRRDHYEKYVLRRAMDGLLPTSLTARRVRSHVGWEFIRTLRSEHASQGLDRGECELLRTWLADDLLESFSAALAGSAESKLSSWNLDDAYALARWLLAHLERPHPRTI
jgi:asparagine synthetase B (glutamine-hydrolysing)